MLLLYNKRIVIQNYLMEVDKILKYIVKNEFISCHIYK